METLTGLLKKGQEILVQAGIEEAGLDARLLLEYITGKSRAYYLAHGEECVTKETADRYLELVTGRSQHIPLQHLTHQAFFMGDVGGGSTQTSEGQAKAQGSGYVHRFRLYPDQYSAGSS